MNSHTLINPEDQSRIWAKFDLKVICRRSPRCEWRGKGTSFPLLSVHLLVSGTKGSKLNRFFYEWLDAPAQEFSKRPNRKFGFLSTSRLYVGTCADPASKLQAWPENQQTGARGSKEGCGHAISLIRPVYPQPFKEK
jgi:hypothetical protein